MRYLVSYLVEADSKEAAIELLEPLVRQKHRVASVMRVSESTRGGLDD